MFAQKENFGLNRWPSNWFRRLMLSLFHIGLCSGLEHLILVNGNVNPAGVKSAVPKHQWVGPSWALKSSDLNDNDNDVYFTLATSDGRIGKYKAVGEQLTHI